MQDRFRQFPTPYDAWWHHRRRLRSARLCALLTALLMPGFAVLLSGFPHHAVWQSEGGNAHFTAVPYAAPELPADTAPTALPTTRPALRAPQVPPPAVPTLVAADILPEPAEEVSADISQDEALVSLELDTPLEDEQDAVVPTRPRRALASAAPAASAPAKCTPPAYRDAPKPPYPAALRSRRIGGSVGVRIAVSSEGMPTEVTITAPSGYAELDRSTRRWILTRWRFRPAEADGKPIAAHVQTRIDYRPD